ncbi:MAG: N5-carboxyaminoimidazole ribonucleotide mutase, partial [uncultured Acetobacteraceae bacterium]
GFRRDGRPHAVPATSGRRDHGQPLRLGDHAPRRRSAGRLGGPPRNRRGVRAPHPGALVQLRRRRGSAGPQSADRRRRRRGAPAGHGGGDDPPARPRRAGREPRAQGHGQPALHRPDAGRRAGRDAGHRARRRGQRRAARRRHPRLVGPCPGRAAGGVARRPDRGRADHAGM